MSLIKHTIKFSDKSKPVIAIQDDDIDDTSTSLTMCSYNSLNSTNILNNSVLHLMEHFCGPTEPRSPTAGQLWVDTSGAPDEPDRLKVYISQSPGVLKFMDVGGTVISKTGSLRHTGQIEAVDDYNKIPKVIGTPSDYYKFLTTKRYCDENYLSGMNDEGNVFVLRNDRRVVYNSDVSYTATLVSPDADEAALVPRKYLDDNFLNGFNNPDNTFAILVSKPIYYTSDRVHNDPFELVTKKYVLDVNDKLFQDYAGSMQSLLDRLDAALKMASDARDSAEAAYKAFMALPVPSIALPATFNGVTCNLATEDTSLPSVDSYTGTNTTPRITGTLTTASALATGATYEIKVDNAVVSSGITVIGNTWALDTSSLNLNWTAPSTHTILVTRTETSGTSYSNTDTDQINITVVPVLPVPTVSPAAGTTSLPIEVPDIEDIVISGTVGATALGVGETFSVSVKKVGATVGLGIDSANLVVTGTDWTLTLPTLSLGTTYDVTATRVDASGTATNDATSGELVVTTPATVAAPTLTPLVTSRKWPKIEGTVGTIPFPVGKDFKVKINNIEYTTVLDATRLNWSVTLDSDVPAQKLPLGAVNVIVKRFGKQSTVRVINVVDYLRVYNPKTMHSAAYMNYSLKFLEEDLIVGYYMYTAPDGLKVKIDGVVVAETQKNGTYAKVPFGYPSDLTQIRGTTSTAWKDHMHYLTIPKSLINDTVVLGIYINEEDDTGLDTDFHYVLQVAGDLQPIGGKTLKQGKPANEPANWVPLVVGAYTINLDGSVTSL